MTEALLSIPLAWALMLGAFLSTAALLERQVARQEAIQRAIRSLAENPDLPEARVKVRGVTVFLKR